MEISKAKIKLLSSLSVKKHRQREGLFVAEGTKCVLDTLDYFDLESIIVTKSWIEQHDLSKLSEDKICIASNHQIEQISSLSTPPEVMAVYRLPLWTIDENKLMTELTLVLDGVQDPGNLGTIIRVADWFGIHQIIASKETVDLFNPKSIQATMGAISRVKVFYEDIPDILGKFPTLPIYGTLLDGIDIYKSELSDRGFIIMGNEGKGITEKVRSMVTNPLFIPSYPADCLTSESLNVGVATAITVAEFRRRTYK